MVEWLATYPCNQLCLSFFAPKFNLGKAIFSKFEGLHLPTATVNIHLTEWGFLERKSDQVHIESRQVNSSENDGMDYIVNPLVLGLISIAGIGPVLNISKEIVNKLIIETNLSSGLDPISIRALPYLGAFGILASTNILNGYKNFETWKSWIIDRAP